MNISELDNSICYLDDLRDVVFSGSPVLGTAITVKSGNTVILEHFYYGDPNGEVHLDLRDLVRNRTSASLPSSVLPTEVEGTDLPLTVIQDQTSHEFTAIGYREGIASKLSGIDYMCVPGDYRLLMTMPRLAETGGDPVVTALKYIDHVHTQDLESLSVPSGSGSLVSWFYDLSAGVLPVLRRRPFCLELTHQVTPSVPSLRTPVLEVVNGDFEQYAFRTDYGGYENIAMSGDLRVIPEYTFENARHPSGNVRVSSEREDIREQSSGPLTEKTAALLCSLLTSPAVYHLEDGEWVRILIKSPSVSISRQSSVRTVTFSWIYSDIEK